MLRSGYNYFGIPDFGMNFANYNFKDTTGDFNNIIAQLYIRQALAHLVDEQGWITAFMHGAGAPPTGPSRLIRRARTCRPTRRPTRTRSASRPRSAC